jgi:hypothetical protein
LAKATFFFIFLLASSVFSLNYWLFYSSPLLLEIRPVFGDDPINPDVSTSGEGTDAQPSTEGDDQSTDPSSNEATPGGGTDPSNGGDQSTDPSSNEVTDPSSNAPGGGSDPSNGCDLSSANPTETGGPGCVDVEPGIGHGADVMAKKKKKPVKDLIPSPCIAPCANNTTGNGPFGDNDPPPNP